jgi:hypothetical protein
MNISVSEMLGFPSPQFPWRTIRDYAVFNRDGRLIVAPWLAGFHHVEASHQFDERYQLDSMYGLNRAVKYLPIYRQQGNS